MNRLGDLLRVARVPVLPALAKRWTGREIQEDVGADENDRRRMLRDFRMINAFISDTRGLLCRELVQRMRHLSARPVRVLDAGCGGCDQARWLARYCRHENLDVHITCIDSDPRAIAFGQQACAGIAEIDVRLGDAFNLESAVGPVDFIMTNHVLHHIDSERIPCLLASLRRKAVHGFIVSDLRRTYGAYIGFALLAAVLWPRGVTRYDGLLSIRKGFTPGELVELVEDAGLSEARVWTRFPARIGISCFY